MSIIAVHVGCRCKKRNDMRKISNPFAGKEGYRCFGCCHENPIGVHMDFYEDGDDVVCFWKPSPDYQGWVNVLHGGIQGTLLDETAAWVVFRKLQTMGVTSRLEIKYRKPVLTTDTQLTLRGHLVSHRGRLAQIEVTLANSMGEVCTEAAATYYLFDEKTAREKGFEGCGVEGEEMLF